MASDEPRQSAADLQWAEVERTKPHPGKRPPLAISVKDTVLGEFDRLADDLAEYVRSSQSTGQTTGQTTPSHLRIVK